MGRTQRKYDGQWIDLEDFERLQEAGSVADMTAQDVLDAGDYHQMGSWLKAHSDDPVPSGKEDRIEAVEAMTGDDE